MRLRCILDFCFFNFWISQDPRDCALESIQHKNIHCYPSWVLVLHRPVVDTSMFYCRFIEEESLQQQALDTSTTD
jgi:hypothetical protein